LVWELDKPFSWFLVWENQRSSADILTGLIHNVSFRSKKQKTNKTQILKIW